MDIRDNSLSAYGNQNPFSVELKIDPDTDVTFEWIGIFLFTHSLPKF